MNMGERLREARREKGLSQVELARRAGVRQSTLSDLERGVNTGSRDAAKLAAVLGVSALWLSEGKGSKHGGPDLLRPVPVDRRIVSDLMVRCAKAAFALMVRRGQHLDMDDQIRLACRLYEQFLDSPETSADEILARTLCVLDILEGK